MHQFIHYSWMDSVCWFAHAAEAVKCECLFWYVHLNIFELYLICTLYIPSTAKICLMGTWLTFPVSEELN